MKLLTVDQAAEYLLVARSTVYGLLSTGRLPYYSIGPNGGAKRISEADLQAYLESCRQGAEPHKQPRPRHRLKHISLRPS